MKFAIIVAAGLASAYATSSYAHTSMATVYAAPAQPIPYSQMDSCMSSRRDLMNGDAPAMPDAGGAPRHMRHAEAHGLRAQLGEAETGMNGDAPAMTAAPAAPRMRHSRSGNTTPAMNGDAPAMPGAAGPH